MTWQPVGAALAAIILTTGESRPRPLQQLGYPCV